MAPFALFALFALLPTLGTYRRSGVLQAFPVSIPLVTCMASQVDLLVSGQVDHLKRSDGVADYWTVRGCT